jgi:hypothetical protein
MNQLSYDPTLHVLVVRVAGAQTTADHEGVIAAVDTLDRNGREKERKVGFILVLSSDTTPPNAYWRKRYADQRKAMSAPRVFISVVTDSAILRGVMTAMNWISPDPPNVKSMNHATFQESAVWIEQMQGTSQGALRRRYETPMQKVAAR